mmetsp:Transcript_167038/g.320984  ORF Transcript_167038/g.320984 Transcript_167038/m.320984 type:complete len:88 (-) Transcript_167038:23-286(-)
MRCPAVTLRRLVTLGADLLRLDAGGRADTDGVLDPPDDLGWISLLCLSTLRFELRLAADFFMRSGGQACPARLTRQPRLRYAARSAV